MVEKWLFSARFLSCQIVIDKYVNCGKGNGGWICVSVWIISVRRVGFVLKAEGKMFGPPAKNNREVHIFLDL